MALRKSAAPRVNKRKLKQRKLPDVHVQQRQHVLAGIRTAARLEKQIKQLARELHRATRHAEDATVELWALLDRSPGVEAEKAKRAKLSLTHERLRDAATGEDLEVETARM